MWGSAAESVEWGVIHPSVSTPAAIGIEALMVGAIVVTMFIFLSSERTVRWTPLAAGLMVALATWKGAPHTGTGLNPARTLGPQVVATDFASVGVLGRGRAGGNGSCCFVETWPPDSTYREAVPRSVPPVGVP
jgi:glycerol uptake facilitator-like aquaporin